MWKKQYLVPYLMSSHPGCSMKEAVELACYLHEIHHMPQQVQDFYPTPSTISTCMYYTGIDPRDGKPVYVEKNPHYKALQRALMQYGKQENYKLVEEALTLAGRRDLIGYGKECLIRPEKKKESFGEMGKQAPMKEKLRKSVKKKRSGTFTQRRKADEQMKKAEKGSCGYIQYQKKKRLVVTFILFLIPLAIYATGYIQTKTRLNTLDRVFSCCLPACKSLVGLIMIFMQKPMSHEQYEKAAKAAGGLTAGYETGRDSL